MSPQKPVDVRDVSRRPVPMLRAFGWVATALQAFRERPLPGAYQTEITPTFDLFAASRVAEMQFEETLGALGAVEVVGSLVPEDKHRLYVSLAFMHDDAGTKVIQPVRILATPGGFPFAPFEDPARDGAAPAGEWFTTRMVTVPPGGRIGVECDAMLAGARATLRGVFIDFDVGEPFSSIS